MTTKRLLIIVAMAVIAGAAVVGYICMTQPDNPAATHKQVQQHVPKAYVPPPLKLKPIPEDAKSTPPLVVPFEILHGGKLIVARPDERRGTNSFPEFANYSLFLVFPDGSTPIWQLNALRGRVRIRTPEEALAFCRLLTSPVTWYVWAQPDHYDEMEPVSKDNLPNQFFFRNKEEDPNWGSIFPLVAPKEGLAKIGITPATVKRTAEGYEIHRTLYRQIWGDGPSTGYLADVVETVRPDGTYIRESHKRAMPNGGTFFCLPLSGLNGL